MLNDDNTTFFSIIIPLYNKESYIRETLNSVLAQTYTNYEIIIINDGSTDKSLEIAQSFSDKRLRFIDQDNQGLSIARNNGIKAAKSEFIAFIDADDLWKVNHLQQLYNLIKDYPDKAVYGTGYMLMKSKKVFHRAVFNNLPEHFRGVVPNFFNHSMQHCIAWVSSICIPKKILEELNYFDPDIFSEQDTDLYIRIALNDYDYVLDNTLATAIHNRTMADNLSNFKTKLTIPKLLYAYKDIEANNVLLKRYIDLNRFSTAVFFKLSSKKKLEKELKKSIDKKSLTMLQCLILISPNFLVRIIFYIKEKLFLNPFIVFKQSV